MAMSPSFVPPPKGDLAQLARLGRFLLPYRHKVAVALVALIVAASCVLALGQGLRYVIDAGFGSRDPQLLNAALALGQMLQQLEPVRMTERLRHLGEAIIDRLFRSGA